MSNVWQDHKPSTGGGDYLKLVSGDKKKVRFASDPAIITYDGVKLRYLVVLYNKTDKVAQIYEFGPQVFGQIGDLADDWGEPKDFDMNISRQGSGQFDTSYSVNPVPKSEMLTKEEQEKVDAVKFPGNRSRMLAAYMEDGIMPETIETNKQSTNYATDENELKSLDEVAPVEDEPINLEDIPF